MRRMVLPPPRPARRTARDTTPPPTVTLLPATGCSIRDPDTLILLDPAGQDVVLNDFYRRRLICGDVTDITGQSTVMGGLATEHHRRRSREG